MTRHVIETAKTGRSKCRGCDLKIEKGEARFGERVPNAFGDGETTLWFHLRCAAYKRPEPLLETLPGAAVEDADALKAAAELGIAHRRLPRLSGAERAPTSRARCRSCRKPIERGAWRLSLVFFEEYRFEPSGFIHAACAGEYFGTTELLDRVRHFVPELEPDQLEELAAEIRGR
ncbi:MAG TPA: PARP-type zinc finger-containing protein [Gammaproteobacteria bacterium]